MSKTRLKSFKVSARDANGKLLLRLNTSNAAAVAVSLPPTQDEEVDILFQIKQQNEMTSLL